jgi:hypothetical protein
MGSGRSIGQRTAGRTPGKQEERKMKPRTGVTAKKALTLIALAALAVAATPQNAIARGPETEIELRSYATMAPFEKYLMDRFAEIVLARSAAPAAVSKDATIMVLTQYGYVIAVEGKNGFVCLVGRSWFGRFDDPEFWNPEVRVPVTLDPQAVRTVLPIMLRRTELAIMGYPKAEIVAREKASFEKEFGPLAAGVRPYIVTKR